VCYLVFCQWLKRGLAQKSELASNRSNDCLLEKCVRIPSSRPIRTISTAVRGWPARLRMTSAPALKEALTDVALFLSFVALFLSRGLAAGEALSPLPTFLLAGLLFVGVSRDLALGILLLGVVAGLGFFCLAVLYRLLGGTADRVSSASSWFRSCSLGRGPSNGEEGSEGIRGKDSDSLRDPVPVVLFCFLMGDARFFSLRFRFRFRFGVDGVLSPTFTFSSSALLSFE